MPKAATDFRKHAFDDMRVDTAGQEVGRKVDWQHQEIEHLMRIIIHSVLTVQLGKDWWDVVADPDLKKDIAQMMRSYANRPWHSGPGRHEVYYIYLSTLTKIMTSNSAQFQPHIPDVDAWTAK